MPPSRRHFGDRSRLGLTRASRVLFAVLVAVSSVLLGAAVSFVPNRSRTVLGYMRTFATLAALAVVVTHLLPEALRQLGLPALLLFLGGWFAPAAAHFVGQRSTRGRVAHAVLEAGYWGLVVHHVADGIGLGTYTRLPTAQGTHLDVIVALAAHTVPLIAVVSLAYRTTYGARSAVLRSLGLALASVVGIAFSSLISAQTIERFAPIIAAVAAGLLLHVVTHDLTADQAFTPFARLLDLGVAALGVSVSLLGVWHSTEPGIRAFARRLAELSERTSLVILVGLLAAAFSLRLPDRRSVLARATLPAGALGPESVLLTLALLGFTGGGLRLLLTGAAVAARGLMQHAPMPEELITDPPWRARALEALERSGPWLVLGLLFGALLSTAPVNAAALRSANLSSLLAIALVANLTPMAAPAAVLIATGLSAIGFSSGASLLFATLAPICALLGPALWVRLLASGVCMAAAAASDGLGLSASALDGSLSAGGFGARAAVALALLFLFGIWQRGARLWLSTIVPPAPHEHEHAHDVHGPHS